jgi:PAS domain S-box-containing protein
MSPSSPSRAASLAGLATMGVLAAGYYAAARLGLSLGIVEQVTAVWPPTGIALAALWLLGMPFWPGVFAGALLANLGANEPVGSALGIAVGNTLEALFGVWLLRSAGFDGALQRLRDILALISAACVAATVSATIGVACLCVGEVHGWSAFRTLWPVWWVGDVMGALLVAPVLLTSGRWRRLPWRAERGLELALIFFGAVTASSVAFVSRAGGAQGLHTLAFVVFPFVIWSALRFGQPGVALTILLASSVATWGTAGGLGPFHADDGDPWLYLQAFMAVVATTGLVLGAAVAERDRAERHRTAEYAVTRALAESGDLRDAASRIVEAICDCLDFDVGGLWTVDREAGVLRCVDLWHEPRMAFPEFITLSRSRTFSPGVGLPGRVWTTARPAWIEDVVRDANFPRAAVAAREGLHAAFGFPIVLEGEVLGVIEFFSHDIRAPDVELLQLLTSIGSQIGQYIERKSAEEAVRTSEARKAGVLASVPDAIVTIDQKGQLREFNHGAERMFGYSAAEVLGKEMASLIVPERLRAQHRFGIARYLETGVSSLLDRRVEMPALRADGSEFPVELSIRRVQGAEPPLITGCLRDITERRQAEEDRARLLAREQAARSRAEALAEDLRAQQKAKDRFLAMLGHELRNPLAPVTNALEVLRLRGGTDPETRRLHDMMGRQIRHMTRLVDDLLDVSRIGRGTIAMRRETVDLTDVVGRVLEANRALFDERRHRVAVELPAEALAMEGDPTRLEQVAANLLNNAARYTKPGGEVAVSLASEGGTAVLRVRDNGIGIRPELLQRVFDPFLQADRVPGSVQEGLGLGLTLVKELVEMHGGTVEARSAGPGRGSEFVVRLPLGARAQPASTPSAAPAAVRAARKRILVVDDNRDSAETLALLMRLAGHDTAVAFDGRQALAEFRARRPDVVLLDIELPDGVNGYEVALRLAQEPGADGVVWVAVTGYGQPEDQQRSRAAGFRYHLVKPVDPKELARVLASLE